MPPAKPNHVAGTFQGLLLSAAQITNLILLQLHTQYTLQLNSRIHLFPRYPQDIAFHHDPSFCSSSQYPNCYQGQWPGPYVHNHGVDSADYCRPTESAAQRELYAVQQALPLAYDNVTEGQHFGQADYDPDDSACALRRATHTGYNPHSAGYHFHHGGSCYARADQNLGGQYYEVNDFITLTPETMPPSGADNYLDCRAATALPPTGAQNMFPSTVSQDLGVLYYEANNFSPADSVPLPASNHPDCQVATAFSPVDAQAISPTEDTAHDIFPIKVITLEAASTTGVSHGCQPPPESLVQHGVAVAPLVGTAVSTSPAGTPRQNIDHLEDIYDPAPAAGPASPSLNSDTDHLPLQSSTDEDPEM